MQRLSSVQKYSSPLVCGLIWAFFPFLSINNRPFKVFFPEVMRFHKLHNCIDKIMKELSFIKNNLQFLRCKRHLLFAIHLWGLTIET